MLVFIRRASRKFTTRPARDISGVKERVEASNESNNSLFKSSTSSSFSTNPTEKRSDNETMDMTHEDTEDEEYVATPDGSDHEDSAAEISGGEGAPTRKSSFGKTASRLGSNALASIKNNVGQVRKLSNFGPFTSNKGASDRRSSSGEGFPAEASVVFDFGDQDGPLNPIPSLAPPHHRENTALHALRDTFVFPSLSLNSLNPFALLPDFRQYVNFLPTIPCMSGLGQSNIFSEGDMLDSTVRTETDNSTGKSDAFRKLKGNVMMMGGYRGSILRDTETDRRLWVPLRVGFNVRKVDLTIGPTSEDEKYTSRTVVPGKALAAIAGFVDLGKRLKDKLKELDRTTSGPEKVNFRGWGYDWRRSLHLSSELLIKSLEATKAETGRGTLVIAHSMGGLVALHALSQCSDPTIFSGIIFGSTPFNGTPNILQPFRYGDSILFNKQICSPSTVFSFRSSFYLLPQDNVCFETPQGKPIPVDFFHPQAWSKYGFSPMTAGLLDENVTTSERQQARAQAEEAVDVSMTEAPSSIQQLGSQSDTHISSLPSSQVQTSDAVTRSTETVLANYLERTLSEVQTFRESLVSGYDPTKKDLYPPLVILASRRTPTVRGCLVDGIQDIIDGNYDRLLFGEGDGIITYASATALPKVWQHHVKGVVESGNGHVSILSDLNAMRKALDILHANQH